MNRLIVILLLLLVSGSCLGEEIPSLPPVVSPAPVLIDFLVCQNSIEKIDGQKVEMVEVSGVNIYIDLEGNRVIQPIFHEKVLRTNYAGAFREDRLGRQVSRVYKKAQFVGGVKITQLILAFDNKESLIGVKDKKLSDAKVVRKIVEERLEKLESAQKLTKN